MLILISYLEAIYDRYLGPSTVQIVIDNLKNKLDKLGTPAVEAIFSQLPDQQSWSAQSMIEKKVESDRYLGPSTVHMMSSHYKSRIYNLHGPNIVGSWYRVIYLKFLYQGFYPNHVFRLSSF